MIFFLKKYIVYDELIVFNDDKRREPSSLRTTIESMDAKLATIFGERQQRVAFDDDDEQRRRRLFVSKRDAIDATHAFVRYRFDDDERHVTLAHVTLRCASAQQLDIARRRIMLAFANSNNVVLAVVTPQALQRTQLLANALRDEIELWRRTLSSALRVGRDDAVRATAHTISLLLKKR